MAAPLRHGRSWNTRWSYVGSIVLSSWMSSMVSTIRAATVERSHIFKTTVVLTEVTNQMRWMNILFCMCALWIAWARSQWYTMVKGKSAVTFLQCRVNRLVADIAMIAVTCKDVGITNISNSRPDLVSLPPPALFHDSMWISLPPSPVCLETLLSKLRISRKLEPFPFCLCSRLFRMGSIVCLFIGSKVWVKMASVVISMFLSLSLWTLIIGSFFGLPCRITGSCAMKIGAIVGSHSFQVLTSVVTAPSVSVGLMLWMLIIVMGIFLVPLFMGIIIPMGLSKSVFTVRKVVSMGVSPYTRFTMGTISRKLFNRFFYATFRTSFLFRTMRISLCLVACLFFTSLPVIAFLAGVCSFIFCTRARMKVYKWLFSMTFRTKFGVGRRWLWPGLTQLRAGLTCDFSHALFTARLFAMHSMWMWRVFLKRLFLVASSTNLRESKQGKLNSSMVQFRHGYVTSNPGYCNLGAIGA